MVSNVKVEVRKDFVGNDLTIGTKVIYMQVGYRNFKVGVIVSMGDKKGSIMPCDGKYKTIQFYNQMIRTNNG